MRLVLGALLSLAAPARADLSLVQIVQSQSSAGQDGLFGKHWVEVSGRRMRLVSGFVGKLTGSGRRAQEPKRFVQLVDLDSATISHLDPVGKTYVRTGLSEVSYADSLHSHPSGGPGWSVSRSSVVVEKGGLKRRLLGSECSHYHILVDMSLEGPAGKKAAARMAQDVWVASVSGEIQKGLLDLISFEAAYRRKTGSLFSPLDYEVYQVREAAAYMRVPEADLRALIVKVKAAFLTIPGYPLSSSVSWWREGDAGAPSASEPPPPRRMRRPFFRPSRLRRVRSFYSRDWGRAWDAIDERRESDERDFAGSARRPRRGRVTYAEFQREMTRVIEAVAPRPPDSEPPRPPDGRGASPGPRGGSPFYEIFAEMHDIDFKESVPPQHFMPPPGYREVRLGP